MAWKRSDWNALIQRVNALIDNGCASGTKLAEVGTKHRWSVSDITQVRNTLTEMCANAPTFSAELKLWKQDIIDELNNAIDECQCSGLSVGLSFLSYVKVWTQHWEGPIAYTSYYEVDDSSSRSGGVMPVAGPVSASETLSIAPRFGAVNDMLSELSQDYSAWSRVVTNTTDGSRVSKTGSSSPDLAIGGWYLLSKGTQLAPSGFAGRFATLRQKGPYYGGMQIAQGQLGCDGRFHQTSSSARWAGRSSNATYSPDVWLNVDADSYADSQLALNGGDSIMLGQFGLSQGGWLGPSPGTFYVALADMSTATVTITLNWQTVCYYPDKASTQYQIVLPDNTLNTDTYCRAVPTSGYDYCLTTFDGTTFNLPATTLLNLNTPIRSPFCYSLDAVNQLLVAYNKKNPTAKLAIDRILPGGPPNGLADFGDTPNIVLLVPGA